MMLITMYTNYNYDSVEQLFSCELGNYSRNEFYAFFQRIECGDYFGLIIFLSFTIVLILFVMTLSKYNKL